MIDPAFVRTNLRWLAAGVLLTFASSAGQTFFIALFAGQLRQAFDLSHGAFGSLYMAATLSSALTLVWLGKLADSVPPGRLAAMVLIGLGAIGGLLSIAQSIPLLFLSLYGLRLLGQGMPGHIAITSMGRWYRRRRGQAVSLVVLGQPLGEGVLPAAVVALMLAIGWRETWLVIAAVLALGLAPLAGWLLARSPPPEQDAIPGTRATTGDLPPPARPQRTRAEVLRDPVFLMLIPFLMAPPMLITGLLFHQVDLVAVKGWELADFAASYPAYAALSVLCSLGMGWLIDRFTAIRLMALVQVPLAAGLTVAALAGASWAAPVLMGLMGASAGMSITQSGPLWAELYGTEHLGAIRALVVGALVGSTAAAPGLMGLLLDSGIRLESQLLAFAGYAALGTVVLGVLSLRLRPLQRLAAPTVSRQDERNPDAANL